ncbi:MAG: rhomboid family intramembrane serine protease [Planctomycetaceae bacterium]
MRELTTLTNQQHAERLAGYLVTQSIPASLEEEQGKWVIWVVNDDDREAAHEILEVFRQNPEDSSYDVALVQAKKLAKQEANVQKKVRRREVDLTKRWSGHWWYARPATTILIVVSVLVAIVCTDWNDVQPGMMGLPALCTNEESALLQSLYVTKFDRTGEWIRFPVSPWGSVLRGEFWRPITPIFIHFGVLHILFNMMWMNQLGAAVEFVKGPRRYIVLVFLLAVTSNLAQFYWSGPMFGGMSGVVFGIIGYTWMQGKTQPHEGLGLPQQTLVFAILWLFLCMGGALGSIANAAHLVGFAVGMFLGARQMLWKSVMRRLRS